MGSFTLGKYLPLNSCIHKLDPRAKIIAMLIVLIAIFIPAGWLGYGLIALAVISLIFMAKLSLKFVIKAMKPMLFMMVFLLVINILVVKSGTIILSIGSFVIYTDAIIQTLYIVVRLVLMIMITTALTATTKPLDLTLGIEDLLKPFARFKVPSHEIAMLISIALRFIPDLIEETQRIMKAQIIQADRYKKEDINFNSELNSKQLKRYCQINQNSLNLKYILSLYHNTAS